MHGVCFELPLQKWFDFKIPKTTIAPDYILKAITTPEINSAAHNKTIWIGVMPTTSIVQRSKKGNKWEEMNFHFQTNTAQFTISLEPNVGKWFMELLPLLSIEKGSGLTYAQIKESYASAGLDGFELCWDNKPITGLYKAGLLLI